jgi:hypothetical protein
VALEKTDLLVGVDFPHFRGRFDYAASAATWVLNSNSMGLK